MFNKTVHKGITNFVLIRPTGRLVRYVKENIL